MESKPNASRLPVASPVQFELEAKDGYPLGATLFEHSAPIANLIVAGATGVPQGFYRRFAEYANRQGYRVLTLDFRGVGRSAPRSLKGFKMDYLDWAHQDLSAAVDHMASDERPLYLVGHSFGGHAIGLLPNHNRITASYAFGTGSGWHGWMPKMEQLRVLLMWHVIAPILTRIKGYLAWSVLGMGEDLPMGVYRRWKRWCSNPHYFFDDTELPHLSNQFASVSCPIFAANAVDDLWAPPQSRDAFICGYKNAPQQTLDILPGQHAPGPIGHMGYFRASSEQLWKEALDWLQSVSPTRAQNSNRRDR